MIAKSGDALLQPAARAALVEAVLPLADVVTPNLHEAGALAEIPVATEADMEEAARRILKLGPKSVLVKGGHLAGAATDILWTGGELTRFTAPRLDSANTPRPRRRGPGGPARPPAPRRRHPRGQGVRDRGDPRGLPAGARRGRAPPLPHELVADVAGAGATQMGLMGHPGGRGARP